MPESLGVVVACLTLDLAFARRRPRRTTVTVAIVGSWTPGPAAAVAVVVALPKVRHPIPGIRSSAAAIFVVRATFAVTVVTAAAVAATAAAPLVARRATAVHAYTSTSFQSRAGRGGVTGTFAQTRSSLEALG